ncbi:type II secretion system F family protein [Candidatus Saccharibacteria bacterium]|nr:type II secretion system F family protein [Candidatus Saccharibacteria bacterium]
MKKFSYKVKDKVTGKIVKGEISADSKRAAGKALIDQGYILQDDIYEVGQENALMSFLNRITTKDKIVFTRQFATLIGAGLPLAQALRTVSEQTENKRMRAVVDDILASVESGSSLKDAFSKFPDVFDKVYLALIAAGEMSGTLDESLRRIATQQEKDAAMMSKIRGALTYPAIVLVVIGLVMAFMMVQVVPQVKRLFKDMHQALPFATEGLIAISDFMISFWWLVLIGLGVGGYFFRQYLKTEPGIKFAANFKLNVPLFSPLFRKLYMARFARTGQLLLSTGVALLDMLNICGDAMNNVIVKKSIDEAGKLVQGGKNLSESLKGKDYILDMVPQMINIGEQSGKIDEMLGKTAQVYEDELDEQIKAISTLIEPILMVVMALMAGGLIGAILFPIYSLVTKV